MVRSIDSVNTPLVREDKRERGFRVGSVESLGFSLIFLPVTRVPLVSFLGVRPPFPLDPGPKVETRLERYTDLGVKRIDSSPL